VPEPGARAPGTDWANAPSPRLRTVRFGGAIETVGLLWIYLVYSQLRALAAGSEQVALQNARRLLGWSSSSVCRSSTPCKNLPARGLGRCFLEPLVRRGALRLFRLFPLMPPRLMPPSYHFVDTGRQYFHIDAGLRSQLGGEDKPTTSDFAQGANDFATRCRSWFAFP
jgi:hypothetical protein